MKFYNGLRYLKLLKLMEVIKIMSILKSLNFKKETKALLFIIYYLVLIFVYVHFFACAFWIVARQNSQLAYTQPIWSFGYEFGSLKGGAVFNYRQIFEQFDNTWDPSNPKKGNFWVVMFQYLVSMIFSSLGLALVTSNPVTTLGAIYNSLLILLSAFFMAWLYGEFSTQLGVLRKQQNTFQNRIDLANTTMEYLQIPEGLRDRIRSYIKVTNLPRE